MWVAKCNTTSYMLFILQLRIAGLPELSTSHVVPGVLATRILSARSEIDVSKRSIDFNMI